LDLSRRQNLQKRKTPRSLPSRKPYFDRNDVSRIVNFVESRFLDLASRFSRFGSNEPPPRHVTHHCFFPYLKNAKYEQKPTLMLFMQTIKDIDLGRAKDTWSIWVLTRCSFKTSWSPKEPAFPIWQEATRTCGRTKHILVCGSSISMSYAGRS
jgi:hypothetical protein